MDLGLGWHWATRARGQVSAGARPRPGGGCGGGPSPAWPAQPTALSNSQAGGPVHQEDKRSSRNWRSGQCGLKAERVCCQFLLPHSASEGTVRLAHMHSASREGHRQVSLRAAPVRAPALATPDYGNRHAQKGLNASPRGAGTCKAIQRLSSLIQTTERPLSARHGARAGQKTYARGSPCP